MHFHLPKPMHGWREFVGEVGIIVIGVLIALGAEEAVQSAHSRSEVRELRKSLDHELAIDLGTYRFTMNQRPCLDRRLVELETLLAKAKDGETVRLTGPIDAPFAFSQYTSVWDNKDGTVMGHMPGRARLEYAQLYDEFRNTDQLKQAESNIWDELAQFNEPGPLDLDARRKLRGLITREGGINSALKGNYLSLERMAEGLGIRPEDPADLPRLPHNPLCNPILPAG